MIKKISYNISQMVQNNRLGLWILLLLLTASILLFPVQLRYEYHAIESLSIFGDKFTFFVILYCLWLAILILLLFCKGGNSEWQRLGLVCIFSLVFWGFWAINTPSGSYSDELWNMAHIKYLQETGHIASLPTNLGYFQFPVLHLTVFSLSGICGLGIFTTRVLYLIVSSLLLAILSYVMFTKLLKDSQLASLATLLMAGGLLASQEFWPGNPALLFLILILALLVGYKATPIALTLMILLAAFNISYLPAAACFIFILLGIYLLQSIAKKTVLTFSIIILFIVMFLTWEIYYATHFFHGLVGFIPVLIQGIVNPMDRLTSGYSGLVTPNIAPGVPFWAELTRIYWVVLVLGLGTILGLWNLIKARKLNSTEVLEIGGVLGVAVFFVISFFITPGIDSGLRSLRYLPLFTIPILLGFLSHLSQNTPPATPLRSLNSNGFRRGIANCFGWCKRSTFAVLVILFLVSSLPLFLVDKTYVCSDNIYPYENSAGRFIESTYTTKGLELFSDEFTGISYTYYCIGASFQNVLPTKSADSLITNMNGLIYKFQNSSMGNSIFVLSERFRQPFHQLALVDAADPRWVENINKLAQNDKIYDNGHTTIYEH
jgi:hypothetical protein